jgi:hypothetical protein
MRFEGINAKMKRFFCKNIFVSNKIDKQAQKRVTSSGSGVPEGLQVHETPERRIKEIDYRQ